VLRELSDELELPETGESSGVGLGWVQGSRSLLRTNPKPAPNSASLVDLMTDVPARSILGFLRSTEESSRPLQPFRFRKWVFAHLGETPSGEETIEDLLDGVPQFIRGNLKGKSPQKVFFHAFLGRLHSRNQLEAIPVDTEAVAEAMADTAGHIQRAAAVADFAAVAASERKLVVARLGTPLFYRLISGLEVPVEAPMFAGHRPKTSQYPAFRAVALTNAAERPGPEWVEVPDRTVLFFDEDWNPQEITIE